MSHDSLPEGLRKLIEQGPPPGWEPGNGRPGFVTSGETAADDVLKVTGMDIDVETEKMHAAVGAYLGSRTSTIAPSRRGRVRGPPAMAEQVGSQGKRTDTNALIENLLAEAKALSGGAAAAPAFASRGTAGQAPQPSSLPPSGTSDSLTIPDVSTQRSTRYAKKDIDILMPAPDSLLVPLGTRSGSGREGLTSLTAEPRGGASGLSSLRSSTLGALPPMADSASAPPTLDAALRDADADPLSAPSRAALSSASVPGGGGGAPVVRRGMNLSVGLTRRKVGGRGAMAASGGSATAGGGRGGGGSGGGAQSTADGAVALPHQEGVVAGQPVTSDRGVGGSEGGGGGVGGGGPSGGVSSRNSSKGDAGLLGRGSVGRDGSLSGAVTSGGGAITTSVSGESADIRRGREVLTAITAAAPTAPSGWLQLASLEASAGKPGAARAVLAKAVLKLPHNSAIWCARLRLAPVGGAAVAYGGGRGARAAAGGGSSGGGRDEDGFVAATGDDKGKDDEAAEVAHRQRMTAAAVTAAADASAPAVVVAEAAVAVCASDPSVWLTAASAVGAAPSGAPAAVKAAAAARRVAMLRRASLACPEASDIWVARLECEDAVSALAALRMGVRRCKSVWLALQLAEAEMQAAVREEEVGGTKSGPSVGVGGAVGLVGNNVKEETEVCTKAQSPPIVAALRRAIATLVGARKEAPFDPRVWIAAVSLQYRYGSVAAAVEVAKSSFAVLSGEYFRTTTRAALGWGGRTLPSGLDGDCSKGGITGTRWWLSLAVREARRGRRVIATIFAEGALKIYLQDCCGVVGLTGGGGRGAGSSIGVKRAKVGDQAPSEGKVGEGEASSALLPPSAFAVVADRLVLTEDIVVRWLAVALESLAEVFAGEQLNEASKAAPEGVASVGDGSRTSQQQLSLKVAGGDGSMSSSTPSPPDGAPQGGKGESISEGPDGRGEGGDSECVRRQEGAAAVSVCLHPLRALGVSMSVAALRRRGVVGWAERCGRCTEISRNRSATAARAGTGLVSYDNRGSSRHGGGLGNGDDAGVSALWQALAACEVSCGDAESVKSLVDVALQALLGDEADPLSAVSAANRQEGGSGGGGEGGSRNTAHSKHRACVECGARFVPRSRGIVSVLSVCAVTAASRGCEAVRTRGVLPQRAFAFVDAAKDIVGVEGSLGGADESLTHQVVVGGSISEQTTLSPADTRALNARAAVEVAESLVVAHRVAFEGALVEAADCVCESTECGGVGSGLQRLVEVVSGSVWDRCLSISSRHRPKQRATGEGSSPSEGEGGGGGDSEGSVEVAQCTVRGWYKLAKLLTCAGFLREAVLIGWAGASRVGEIFRTPPPVDRWCARRDLEQHEMAEWRLWAQLTQTVAAHTTLSSSSGGADSSSSTLAVRFPAVAAALSSIGLPALLPSVEDVCKRALQRCGHVAAVVVTAAETLLRVTNDINRVRAMLMEAVGSVKKGGGGTTAAPPTTFGALPVTSVEGELPGLTLLRPYLEARDRVAPFGGSEAAVVGRLVALRPPLVGGRSGALNVGAHPRPTAEMLSTHNAAAELVALELRGTPPRAVDARVRSLATDFPSAAEDPRVLLEFGRALARRRHFYNALAAVRRAVVRAPLYGDAWGALFVYTEGAAAAGGMTELQAAKLRLRGRKLDVGGVRAAAATSFPVYGAVWEEALRSLTRVTEDRSGGVSVVVVPTFQEVWERVVVTLRSEMELGAAEDGEA